MIRFIMSFVNWYIGYFANIITTDSIRLWGVNAGVPRAHVLIAISISVGIVAGIMIDIRMMKWYYSRRKEIEEFNNVIR